MNNKNKCCRINRKGLTGDALTTIILWVIFIVIAFLAIYLVYKKYAH